MEYIIASLMRGNIREYHENLIKELASIFNLKVPISSMPPSHITLKSTFETDKIKDVEKIIDIPTKKILTQTNGFNYFRDKEVIFIDISPSEELISFQKELINNLKKLDWMSFKDTDFEFRPHLTLAFPKLFDNLEEIWNYLQDKPKFNIIIDNLTILKKEEGIWKVV